MRGPSRKIQGVRRHTAFAVAGCITLAAVAGFTLPKFFIDRTAQVAHNKTLKNNSQSTKVFVAKHRLKLGDEISDRDLIVQEWPTAFLPEDFVQISDDVNGYVAASLIPENTVLVRDQLGYPVAIFSRE